MVAVLDDPFGRAVGLLADEDAVDRGGRLEARRRVEDVAGRHSFAPARPRVERHERLAGVDRDAHLQLVLLAGPVADRERGAHGALGIVLVRDRRAEERDDRVADELLHRAAEALELGADVRVVGAKAGVRPPPGRAARRGAVEPTRSAKRTVSILRSRRSGCGAVRAAPQAEQKRASAAFSRPQEGHVILSGV